MISDFVRDDLHHQMGERSISKVSGKSPVCSEKPSEKNQIIQTIAEIAAEPFTYMSLRAQITTLGPVQMRLLDLVNAF